MKNIKKFSIVLLLFTLVFSLNVVMAAKKSNNEKCFSSKTFLVESRDTKGSTHFKIRLSCTGKKPFGMNTHSSTLSSSVLSATLKVSHG